MNHFGKHLMHGILWLIASEILCLILAVSLAILRDHPVIRLIGLVFGITAHVLLIWNCAQKAADEDTALYRRSGSRSRLLKPLLIGLILMIPAYLTYLLLAANPESVLMLNLFPLLNAPFLQIYRYLINGAEPFSAIAQGRRILMLLPPVLTAIAYVTGYITRYFPAVAAFDARSNRT